MGGPDPAAVLAEPAPFATRVLPVPGEALPLSRARNELAAAASGELLVFLDVDCVPGVALVGAHAAAAAAAPGALVVGRTLHLPAGAGAEAEPELAALAEERPSRRALFPAKLTLDRRHDLFWSLNFSLRRESFELVGGFDRGYRGYGIEDTDFARRAAAAGLPLAWARDAVAYHQHHPATRLRREAVPGLVANARRYRRRWGEWPARGWLEELDGRGLVRWDESRDLLEATASPPAPSP
jgi:N-acetylglucosaminyl-diphospho-decaprenol L-rhamnosyltransferase